jgi:hypothetical protein
LVLHSILRRIAATAVLLRVATRLLLWGWIALVVLQLLLRRWCRRSVVFVAGAAYGAGIVVRLGRLLRVGGRWCAVLFSPLMGLSASIAGTGCLLFDGRIEGGATYVFRHVAMYAVVGFSCACARSADVQKMCSMERCGINNAGSCICAAVVVQGREEVD